MRIVRRNRRGLGLEGFRAHTHNMIVRLLCEKERWMVESNSTPSHKMNECTRRRHTHTRHKYSNAFVKRRGAWARANQPLVIRCTRGRPTHTRDNYSNAFVNICICAYKYVHACVYTFVFYVRALKMSCQNKLWH